MRTFLLSIIIPFLGVSSIAYAVDLDAPAFKKTTVRSELKRGDNVVSKCEKYFFDDIKKYDSCIDEILQTNVKNDTDTDAFILGANFGAWRATCLTLDVPELRRFEGSLLWELREATVAMYYSRFKAKQKILELDDMALLKAMGYDIEAAYKLFKRMGEYANSKKIRVR
jgi:hypothetical protein